MADIEAVSSPAAETRREARPYAPSWLNRVYAWVDRLPGPAWVVYLVLAAGLAGVEVAVKWRDGVYATGFYPFHLVLAISPIYSLAAGHFLFDRAGQALDRFQPVLKGGAVAYTDLRYQITTMPARSIWVVSVIGAALMGVLLLSAPGDQWALFKLATSPLATALDYGILIVEWALLGTSLYSTIHILRLVSRIYTRHTDINLFRLGPLYAFSGLTAASAGVWLVGSYSWVVPLPAILSSSSWLGFIAAESVLALVLFIWPLVGAHRLLQAEKDRLVAEIAERLEAAMAEVLRQADAGAYDAMPGLNATIDNLTKQQALVEHYPTWPWRTDTAQLLVSAAVLPIVLWLAQRILERLGF